ncbi:MAG: hypothetical protein ABWK15_07055 [Dissulfuribacterales bacterium]
MPGFDEQELQSIDYKAFLGVEFLTWLYFQSESRGGAVFLPEKGDCRVAFERFVWMEQGEGPQLDVLVCRGLQSQLSEVRAGLLAGKKISRAHLHIAYGEEEFSVTVYGRSLDVSGLRFKGKNGTENTNDEEGLSREADVLEKAYLITQAVEVIERLFSLFLAKRLAFQAWEAERRGFREWLSRSTQ